MRRVSTVPPDLWTRIEADLDQPSARDRLVSLSTALRRGIAAGVLLVAGATLVGAQGVREDLNSSGWALFALCGGLLAVVGGLGVFTALRSRARAPIPTWPWVPLTWAVLLGWSAVGPWPGMTGIPLEIHIYCFEVTSTMVIGVSFLIALLERARRPVPWRVGLIAAGAGLIAFAFQSVFCPGIDLAHLVLGHGGAGIVWAAVAMGVAWVFRQR